MTQNVDTSSATEAAFSAFRASGKTFALDDEKVGENILECLPSAAEAVRIYEGGHWIARMGTRHTRNEDHNWYLILETDEYDTFRSGETLAELERMLFDWAREDELASAMNEENVAAYRTVNLAAAFMAIRPDLKPGIFSEWMDENYEHLTTKERAAARAISDLLEA